MKILIDLLHIRNLSYAGIYIVAVDIVKGLIKYSDYELSLLIWEDQEEYLDNWIGYTLNKILVPIEQKNYLDKRFTIKTPPKELLNKINDLHIDFVFTTCYTINSYIFPKLYNQVGIIYDMQPFRIGIAEGRIKYALHWLLFSFIYYRKLRHIITISQNTTNEVKRFSFRKSTPIYLNIENSLNTLKDVAIPELKDKKYILDVNSFMRYKNTERLILAFSKIKNTIPHYLYLKGYCNGNDRSRYDELIQLVKNLSIEERVIIDINNRSQAEMSYLFKNADLFISPSLMEGFGLTPIEAAVYKCPVIVSNIKTLVEVTDNKVGTFNPISIRSIADSIMRIISNPPTRDERESLSNYFKQKYSLRNQINAYLYYFDLLKK